MEIKIHLSSWKFQILSPACSGMETSDKLEAEVLKVQ